MVMKRSTGDRDNRTLSIADTGGYGPRSFDHRAPTERDGSAAASYLAPHAYALRVRLIESAIILVSGLIVYFGYIQEWRDTTPGYLLLIILGAVLSFPILQAMRVYTVPAFRYVMGTVPRIWLGVGLLFSCLALLIFVQQTGMNFSRMVFVLWLVSSLVALTIFRFAVSLHTRALLAKRKLTRRAVIVGGGPRGESVIDAILADPESDIEICGVFDDRSKKRAGEEVRGFPTLGTVSELVQFGRETHVDLLIVTLPMSAEQRVLQILKQLWVLPVDIQLAAHDNALRLRPRSYAYVGRVPMLPLFDKPLADWDGMVKAIFDRFVASAILVILAPIMLFIGLAVKLDSRGPALFKQKRYGFNNELIEVYKFRSMYTDMSDAQAAKLVTKDDPRVTRVGRIIRKTSLDELPQLFNVLKGELSLVGPRPHALQAKAQNHLYDEVVDGYFARHRVKPGISGWAQINGWRGETDTREKIEQRVEHDLYYIENWSIWLDIYILVMTPFALFDTRSAY